MKDLKLKDLFVGDLELAKVKLEMKSMVTKLLAKIEAFKFENPVYNDIKKIMYDEFPSIQLLPELELARINIAFDENFARMIIAGSIDFKVSNIIPEDLILEKLELYQIENLDKETVKILIEEE